MGFLSAEDLQDRMCEWASVDTNLWNLGAMGDKRKLFLRLVCSKLLAEKHLNLMMKHDEQLNMDYEKLVKMVNSFQKDNFKIVKSW